MGINIAIDGPAGAGKSTIAKKVAKELSFIYVDTGAMYRAMALYLLEKGISGDEKISEACHDADISIRYESGEQQVILNGKNVTAFLRKEEVGNMASVSSANPEVRAHLLKLQRNLAVREQCSYGRKRYRNHYSSQCRSKNLFDCKCQRPAQTEDIWNLQRRVKPAIWMRS